MQLSLHSNRWVGRTFVQGDVWVHGTFHSVNVGRKLCRSCGIRRSYVYEFVALGSDEVFVRYSSAKCVYCACSC